MCEEITFGDIAVFEAQLKRVDTKQPSIYAQELAAMRKLPCTSPGHWSLHRGLRCSYIGDPADHYIIWAPAHQGLAENEAADAAARALSLREASSSPSEQDADPNPSYTFKDIMSYYQSGHSLYPRPRKGLSNADERLLLRLYTNTLLCPATLKHFDPSFTGSCPHCGEVSSDIYHMTCARPSNPGIPPHPNPARKDSEATLLGCFDLQVQRALVGRARADQKIRMSILEVNLLNYQDVHFL
ncbi:uncharacterized protein LOC115331070 [Ixodes scapularis]|uniref:uncharacterized protein LOC115331070 n=1 Tax=Ixodes scapularis TaxID=6945 RepID=UPI001C38D05B|nr:uncharacterized protein LOC115331070 [Ixodes scapularis]